MVMLTPKAAAERLGVSSSLVYQLCNEGVLPCYRFGGAELAGRGAKAMLSDFFDQLAAKMS